MSRAVKKSRCVEAARQVEDRRALHDGVVDVEERRGVRVVHHLQGGLDIGRGRRRATGSDGVRVVPRAVGRHARSLGPLCETAPVAGTEGANVADLVRAAAAHRPDSVALVHRPETGDRTTTTWAALDADVEATAVGLRTELGLHTGDRVALALGSTPAFVTAYFAVLRAGLVAVPLNTGYTAPEVAQLLHDSDAHVVLCDDATLTVAEEAVAESDRALVDPAGLDSVTAAGRGHRADGVGRGGEELAVLMFTSGTSGRPRAAMLSHRALLANLDQCRRLEPAPMTQDDVVLLVLPLFHIYGLNTGLGMVAATGATGVLVERFDPVATAALVRDEGVTNVPGAPPMYVGWTAAEPARRAARRAAAGFRRLAAAAGRAGAGADRRRAAPSTRATASPRPRRWSRAPSRRRR